MARKRRSWPGPLAVALGALSLLAGCRHPGGPPAGDGLSAGGKREQSELTPRQRADVQIAYARSLEKRGEQDQALARYQDAVQQDPDRGDAWLRLAVLHDRQGKFSESAEMYRKALAAR